MSSAWSSGTNIVLVACDGCGWIIVIRLISLVFFEQGHPPALLAGADSGSMVGPIWRHGHVPFSAAFDYGKKLGAHSWNLGVINKDWPRWSDS